MWKDSKPGIIPLRILPHHSFYKKIFPNTVFLTLTNTSFGEIKDSGIWILREKCIMLKVWCTTTKYNNCFDSSLVSFFSISPNICLADTMIEDIGLFFSWSSKCLLQCWLIKGSLGYIIKFDDVFEWFLGVHFLGSLCFMANILVYNLSL